MNCMRKQERFIVRKESTARMSRAPLASIIIDNGNYGAFLGQAIESALAQTYQDIEVIVVDDGSTDNSREVIASYGDRIVSVLKENGGQASAFNAGFSASRGEVVIFLDSDDVLLPTAVERALDGFKNEDIAKVHWPMWEIDETGRRTGRIVPSQPLAEGDVRGVVIRDGPASYVSPPGSGNAWSRRVLEAILPMPEPQFRGAADTNLFALAGIYGSIGRIAEPQGLYRVHGRNNTRKPLDSRIDLFLGRYGHRCLALSDHLRAQGVTVEPGVWVERNAYYGWMRRLYAATREIAGLVPTGSSFILVDEGQWGETETLTGRHTIPFLERDGRYWGLPTDSSTAVEEIERLRAAGAAYMVFAWPCFWWLDYYPVLRSHLYVTARCVLKSEHVVVFDLQPQEPQEPQESA